MSDSCRQLHSWANSLQVFRHGFSYDDLPKNGLYILFEAGEKSHSTNRIVRVGTHTGNDRLGKRLYEHLYKPNKDRSIFRKHIGRCLLHDDPFLEQWNFDLTTKAAKQKYENMVDFEKQKFIEDEVDKYIFQNFSFAVIKADSKIERLEIESSLLATISSCNECSPSAHWLGLKHQNPVIRRGLWNIQGLNGPTLSIDEVNKLMAT